VSVRAGHRDTLTAVRRFTLITILILLLALIAVGIYQLSLGLTIEDRILGPSPNASSPAP
jgi:hypothetical protein